MPKLQQVSAKKTEHVPACPLLQIENTSEVHLQWVQLSEYSPFVSIIFFTFGQLLQMTNLQTALTENAMRRHVYTYHKENTKRPTSL